MSELETKLSEACALAKANGLDLPQLGPLLLDAWNGPPPKSDFDADGMSPPDLDGFVRFQRLETQRKAYEDAGQADAANALRYRYACFPGAAKCIGGSLEQYQAATNASNATFFRGMGTGDWFKVHPAKEYRDAFGNVVHRLDYGVTISDAFPLAISEKGTGAPINRTPAECVEFMLKQAASFVRS